MNNKWLFLLSFTVIFIFGPSIGFAHTGRRLEVKTELDGGMEKLYAQGYSSSGTDDGSGVTRPYINVIHDHWSNVFGAATSGLPSFDVLTAGNLQGYSLYAELVGVTKWVDPPLVEMGGMMMVPDGTIPTLESLTTENLIVSKDSQVVSNGALGTLTLDNSISASGEHLDLIYVIDLEPANVLYALEWVLSTDSPNIMASESIYAILSPDGANMIEKMHMESLYLESYLGNGSGGGGGMNMSPEPSAGFLLCLGFLTVAALRRRRGGSVVFRGRGIG